MRVAHSRTDLDCLCPRRFRQAPAAREVDARQAENLVSRGSRSGTLSARTNGPPGVLLGYFPRVAVESTKCAVIKWSGLPTVLRPRPRASCLYSLAVRQPAFLRPASFIQPLRNQTLPFATLATIRPGVELIPCIAPSFLAFFPQSRRNATQQTHQQVAGQARHTTRASVLAEAVRRSR